MPTLLIPNFSRTARYGFAIVVVVMAALLRQILSTALGAGVPFILFYPAVALAAWFGGFWPGVLIDSARRLLCVVHVYAALLVVDGFRSQRCWSTYNFHLSQFIHLLAR